MLHIYIYIYIYITDKIYLKIIKRHNKNETAMSLRVSRRSHSGDPSSITGPVGVRYVVDTVKMGQGFSPRTSVSPCHYRSTNATYSSSFTSGT